MAKKTPKVNTISTALLTAFLGRPPEKGELLYIENEPFIVRGATGRWGNRTILAKGEYK